MRNLMTVAQGCMEKLDAIGIEYNTPTKWEVNKRAMRRYGQCVRKGDTGEFHINITYRLLDERIPIEFLEDTIIHELVHTVDGCMNHGRKFQQVAKMINDCYSCYHISTYVDRDVCSLVESYYPKKKKTYSWEVQCKSCGCTWKYQRKANACKNPENYHCSCGGRLRAYSIA